LSDLSVLGFLDLVEVLDKLDLLLGCFLLSLLLGLLKLFFDGLLVGLLLKAGSGNGFLQPFG